MSVFESGKSRRNRILGLLSVAKEPLTALQISEVLRLWSGTVYPSLRRLEDEGEVASRWLDADESDENRRRVYSLPRDNKVYVGWFG